MVGSLAVRSEYKRLTRGLQLDKPQKRPAYVLVGRVERDVGQGKLRRIMRVVPVQLHLAVVRSPHVPDSVKHRGLVGQRALVDVLAVRGIVDIGIPLRPHLVVRRVDKKGRNSGTRKRPRHAVRGGDAPVASVDHLGVGSPSVDTSVVRAVRQWVKCPLGLGGNGLLRPVLG